MKDQVILAGGSVFIEGLTAFATSGEPAAKWRDFTGGDGTVAADPSSSAVIDFLAEIPTDASLAGDRVVIDAEYININGIIQSGTPDYTLTLGSALDNQINSIRRSGRSGFVRLDVPDNDQFLVRYDTARDRIVIEEVRVSGGFVDLTGHIANTRNGEIRLLGGYAKIDIDNHTSRDVVIKRIDASQRGDGTLIIKDLAKGGTPQNPNFTIYRKDAGGVTVNENGSSRSGSDNEIYSPEDGFRYGWSVGLEQRVTTSTTYATATWLDIDWLVPDPGDIVDGPHTEIIEQPQLIENSNYYFIDPGNATTYDHVELPPVIRLPEDQPAPSRWTESSWYGKKTYYTRETVEEYQKIIDTHTIEADRPIDVRFLGYDEASVTIRSHSRGRVLLAGKIQNDSGVTTITANSSGIRSLSDSAEVGGRELVMSASSSIGSSKIPVNINVDGSVVATTSNGAVHLAAPRRRIEIRPNHSRRSTRCQPDG